MKPHKVKPSLFQRLRWKKARATGLKIGVAWYTQEVWARICETATDRDKLEATYEEWLHMAENSLREMESAGVRPDKVMIDAEEFLAWCQLHKKQNESGSRAEFASIKMRHADAPRT
jgi:hypothetical protein